MGEGSGERIEADGSKVSSGVPQLGHHLYGLGKRNEVNKLVNKKRPLVLCIQETMIKIIDDFFFFL